MERQRGNEKQPPCWRENFHFSQQKMSIWTKKRQLAIFRWFKKQQPPGIFVFVFLQYAPFFFEKIRFQVGFFLFQHFQVHPYDVHHAPRGVTAVLRSEHLGPMAQFRREMRAVNHENNCKDAMADLLRYYAYINIYTYVIIIVICVVVVVVTLLLQVFLTCFFFCLFGLLFCRLMVVMMTTMLLVMWWRAQVWWKFHLKVHIIFRPINHQQTRCSLFVIDLVVGFCRS